MSAGMLYFYIIWVCPFICPQCKPLRNNYIASKLGWPLCLKTALRVGSVLLFVTESKSLYLEIFRFFTILGKKLFRVSAVSEDFTVFTDNDFISYAWFVWK